jgi:hypothetical protein
MRQAWLSRTGTRARVAYRRSTKGLIAWVDAEGRIVAAQAGSLSATRTAFEIAFKNQKAK